MENAFPKSCSQPAPLEGGSSLPKEQSQLAGEAAGKGEISALPISHYIECTDEFSHISENT